MKEKPKIIVILGQTAVGKSDLAVKIAKNSTVRLSPLIADKCIKG